MTQYTDEQLDSILGGGSRQFTKYRVISIDNGIDIVGTNATGNFVEKVWHEEDEEVVREKFAEDFSGVIVSSKAKLVDKGKKPTWTTGEFDPSDKNEQIAIMQLAGGQTVKNPDGTTKKTFATYDNIKKARRLQQPDGSFQSTYNYFIVLYILVDKEIIKLQFKGTSRGNFFDYSKRIGQLRAKLYNVMTEFSTYVDKTTGKYAISFDYAQDAKGNPVPVNEEAVRAARISLANNFQSFKSLQAPSQAQIASPTDDETPAAYPEDDEEEEIKIEDVPFEKGFKP